MTTFQDPPPQSRRAVRQSERGETPSLAESTDSQNPFLVDDATPSAPVAPAAAPQTGRRARPAAAAPEAPAGEPLTYSTQNRVSPPAAEQYVAEPLAVQPPPAAQGEYRVRDFSPEGGRRSAINREQHASPALAAPVALDYHTQGALPGTSYAAVPEVPLEDTLNHTLSRREMREMRAAEEQAAPALKLPEPIDTLLNSGPIDIPTLAPPPGQSQALADAMAEFDLLTRARREAEAKARDAQVASLQAQPVVVQPVVVQPEPLALGPIQPELVEAAQPPQLIEPVLASVPFPTYPAPGSAPLGPVDQVPVTSVPVTSVPVTSAPVASALVASVPTPAEFVAVDVVAVQPVSLLPLPSVPFASVPEAPAFVASAPAPVASAPAPQQQPVGDAHAVFIEPTPTRTSRSSGHWSAQVDAVDDELPFENTLSRTVGSNTSAITTSALVIPSVPQPDGLLGSIGTTGEILITGSIDLPRSLASTGAHPGRIDNSDFEDDPLDSQVAAPDSAPVRAIRAVSTHTSTRGVIDTKAPQSNKLLTAVIITASVLCVGVIGFLIFAFATNKL
jgi:hypothetical protein